jgi:hypothetical protein
VSFPPTIVMVSGRRCGTFWKSDDFRDYLDDAADRPKADLISFEKSA